MIKVDTEKTIRITRGDTASLVIKSKNADGTDYVFQVGDTIYFRVMKKNKVKDVKLEKSVLVQSATTSVTIHLESADTEFDKYENKPKTYWYEVEIKGSTSSNTIIGYDEDGAKLFIIYPEGEDE
jgi:hypothetical protein